MINQWPGINTVYGIQFELCHQPETQLFPLIFPHTFSGLPVFIFTHKITGIRARFYQYLSRIETGYILHQRLHFLLCRWRQNIHLHMVFGFVRIEIVIGKMKGAHNSYGRSWLIAYKNGINVRLLCLRNPGNGQGEEDDDK